MSPFLVAQFLGGTLYTMLQWPSTLLPHSGNEVRISTQAENIMGKRALATNASTHFFYTDHIASA